MFGFSAYLLFYCTSDFYVFFFFFLFVELVNDATLTSELDMSTPTPIEADDWRLLYALWTGGIDDDILGFVSFYFDNILMCELDILIHGHFAIRH